MPDGQLTAEERAELDSLRAEREALRARLESLERERLIEMRRAAAVMAEAQGRTYWLDRWHLDLNALMATRTGAGFRALMRALRAALRGPRRLMRRRPR